MKCKKCVCLILLLSIISALSACSTPDGNQSEIVDKKPDKVYLEFYDTFTLRDVEFPYDAKNWGKFEKVTDNDPIGYDYGDFNIIYSANVSTDTLFESMCNSIETDSEYKNTKVKKVDMYGLDAAQATYNTIDDENNVEYVNNYFFIYENNYYDIYISCSDYNKSAADKLMKHIKDFILLKSPTYWDSIIDDD
jgi:hypothetical protein